MSLKPEERYNVLITGSRFWDEDHKLVFEVLKKLKNKHGLLLTAIHGDCKGADMSAHWAANNLGIDEIRFPANWNGRRKSAGPIRNAMMLYYVPINLVVAFHDEIKKSSGTKNMINSSLQRNIPTYLYNSKGMYLQVKEKIGD